MSRSILPLLVCPITKQHLFLLSGDRAAAVGAVLARGELRYIDGAALDIEPDRVQFLITQNGHHLYSMIDGVPVLLALKQIDMLL
jgi:uncharacterized protein YbaR (Trm112 family)